MNDTDPGDPNGAHTSSLLEIRRKIDASVPKARIVANLISQGYTPEGASQTYEDILEKHYGGKAPSTVFNPTSKAEKAEAGSARMAQGCLLVVIGLVITSVTFLTAKPGDTFIVTSGMLMIGGFWTLIGVLQWLLNRRR